MYLTTVYLTKQHKRTHYNFNNLISQTEIPNHHQMAQITTPGGPNCQPKCPPLRPTPLPSLQPKPKTDGFAVRRRTVLWFMEISDGWRKGLKRRYSTLAGFEEKGVGICLVKFLQLLSHKSKTKQKGVLYWSTQYSPL